MSALLAAGSGGSGRARRRAGGAWADSATARGALAVIVLALALAPGAARARGELESQLKTVASVELRGRHSVSARELRAVLKTRPPGFWPWSVRPPLRYDFLAADRAAIALAYRQHGFLDVEVGDSVLATRDPGAVRVRYTIREGHVSRISDIAFSGAQAVPEDVLRRGLYARRGRPFNPSYLVADTALLARAYGERGRLPHVVGAAARDARDTLQVHVVYSVDEGPLYHLGDTYLVTQGRMTVREGLIRRELLLKPGAVYKLSRVEDSQQRLYDTGLFSAVQITPLPDSSNTLMEFYVQVHERKPRWVDLGVGSGTAERLRLTAEWGHRNLDLRGLQILVSSQLSYDPKDRSLTQPQLWRPEVAVVEPWIFGTRNQAQLDVYHETRKDRGDTLEIDKHDWGWSFAVRHAFGRQTWLRLLQDNTYVLGQTADFQRTVSDSIKAVLLQDFVPRYATHRLQLGGARDTRDNPLLTTRGSVVVGAADLAGGPFKGSTSFTKFQLGSSWYTLVRSRGWVVATRVRGGLLKPFGARKEFIPGAGVDQEVARVPSEEVFRLGGVNTVRGFDENEIGSSGGLAMLNGNLEVRAPLVGLFGLEVYLDAGNVWARPEYIRMRDFGLHAGPAELDGGDVRYVAGGGLRFNVPFGPVRLDYTWGAAGRLSKHGRVQFAIGPAF